MNKTSIKNFAIWARRKLISDITYKAGMLGITENGIAQPMQQSTKDLQFFDIGTKDYVEISGDEIRQRNALLAVIREKGKSTDYKTAFRNVVEEVAYTWFNRLIAVRFMEVNDYLPSRIRVLSSDNPNKLEPDFVTTPFEADLDLGPYEQDLVMQLKDQNKLDELFRMLFIRQCNKLSEILPELFEQISDYTELLLTISFTDKDGVIYHLTHDISEDDFNVEKEGQVEIIGWLYQYYNTEPKDEVFALLKKNVKITKERIPAATQLFTPDWIVRYMVENSLGRLWVEGHPNDGLKASWKYYLEEAEQEPDVQAQLEKIREGYAKISPEDIKLIDPCMGSGHILVYAFDVLMQIYESYGYTQRDAARSILQNNLYGIDIDTRAYQLAYFSVMMKAREYNRRIFKEGILPNLMAVKNPAQCSNSCLKRLGDLEKQGKRLIDDFEDAEEYGSILQLNYTKEELDALDKRLNEIDEMADYGNLLVQMESEECVNTLAPLVRQARIMSQKYDVVVTNPPYMGAAGMSAKLSEFVKKKYPYSKSDLSTVFMEKAMSMCRRRGYMAMINIPVWMFLSSYEKLRETIVNNCTYISLVHPGRGVFGSDFGTVIFVLQMNHIPEYISCYRRLFDRQGEVASVEVREKQYLSGKGAFTNKQENYKLLPGIPVAYWLTPRIIRMYKTEKRMADVASPKVGMQTSNNDKYLRIWFEINYSEFKNHNDIPKWIKYLKGGAYRKWYGNLEYLLFYNYSPEFILQQKNARVLDLSYLSKRKCTWTDLTISKNSFRIAPIDTFYDISGHCFFPTSESDQYFLLGYSNSVVFAELLKVFNSTIHCQVGDVSKVIVPTMDDLSRERIISISRDCVSLSKCDWDSFETSWDYQNNPIIPDYNERMCHSYRLKDSYSAWSNECEACFRKLKSNEEELNRIFIDYYGLQNELDPDVEDRDVSVRNADLQSDIKSLVSYAVGCMFGRYSLDASGLIYAGGDWDKNKYRSFIPDPDNCIPITDEEYFQDDIVGRFVEFIRVVYGDDTLEENLEFIAEALGNSGKTARDTIRHYFLKDFFKDHCQTYSVTGSGKRPIYWLFDSGKQNGFKALVYMHRWDADTVGNLRIEYLHRMQNIYEKEIEGCQDVIDNSLNNREIAAATKRKEKLVKQLKECKDYDAKVAHIALSRIDIDLDDGVKVNYRKVQTGADGRFCEILADSKNIMVKEDSPIWQSLISNK